MAKQGGLQQCLVVTEENDHEEMKLMSMVLLMQFGHILEENVFHETLCGVRDER